jgi:pimeloyl-ACP methyl ester carboxylesterase
VLSPTPGRAEGRDRGGDVRDQASHGRDQDGEARSREFHEWQIELHGRRAFYRIAGEGPPVVLVHGMLNSSSHWQSVALELAADHTVIAPDLIGHGDSAAPRGDYSLGAHAASIRDLLTALGIERATLVGHSLGGGVAMQFFYQFPARVQRLALVSSGGLGHEVSPMLRTAALPGTSAVLSLAAHPRLLAALYDAGTRMRARGVRHGTYVQALARALRPLERPQARAAFLHTLRSVIDVRGQRVSATDRLYLLESMPTLIVWGERDNTIPLAHGREAHEAVPHSRLRTIPGAAHFPHLEEPAALAAILREFLAETEPCELDDADWGALLSRRSERRRRMSVA